MWDLRGEAVTGRGRRGGGREEGEDVQKVLRQCSICLIEKTKQGLVFVGAFRAAFSSAGLEKLAEQVRYVLCLTVPAPALMVVMQDLYNQWSGSVITGVSRAYRKPSEIAILYQMC